MGFTTTRLFVTLTIALILQPSVNQAQSGPDFEDARFGGSDSTPPKLQTQLYIISGVFGVLMFILILLVLALAVAVARLAKQLKERNGELKYRAVSASGGGSVIEAEHESNMSPPENRRINNGGIANSYVNEGFTGNNHEMEERRREPHNEVDRMGYEAYSYSHARQQQHSVNENRSGNIPRARSDYSRSDSRGGGGSSYRVEHQLNVEESVVPAGGQRDDASPPPEGGDIRGRDRRQSPVAYGNRGPPASSGQRRDNRRY